jgi:sigma-54-specific transcriptional regulator
VAPPRREARVAAAGAAPTEHRLEEARIGLREAVLALLEGGAPRLLDEIDEIVFRTAYELANKNQVRTARLLGISRNILRSRLMQYGLLALDSRRASLRRRVDEDRGPSSSRRPIRVDLGAAE